MPKPPITHTAYVLKRETRATVRWLEVGGASLQFEVKGESHHVYLDRLPVGGFTGHIILHPVGAQPPLPAPARPGEDESD